MSDRTLVRIERLFDAPPEAVFGVWTEREAMEFWYRDGPDFVVTVTELDVRVGGHYRVEFGPPGETPFVECGTYLEIESGRRLVMVESLENVAIPWKNTTVTVEFHLHERGTRVVLTHEGFPSTHHRDLAAGGWPGFLDRIAQLFGTTPTRDRAGG
jgi:uncharacterized protein YndB with AHSA1/START domain